MRWADIPEHTEWGAPGHARLTVKKSELFDRIPIDDDWCSRLSVENHIMGGDPCYGVVKWWTSPFFSIREGEHIVIEGIEPSRNTDYYHDMDPILNDQTGVEDRLKELRERLEALREEDRRIIVYTFHYSPSSGGISILHYLVHCINNMLEPGSEDIAYVCPVIDYPVHGIWFEGISGKGFRRGDRKRPLDEIREQDLMDLRTNPAWRTPIISRRSLLRRNNIVIYNETTLGNPIEQSEIIRWMLYFPEERTVRAWSPTDRILLYSSVYGFGLPDTCPTESTPIFVNISHIFEKTETIPSEKKVDVCFTIRKAVEPELTKFYAVCRVSDKATVPCSGCNKGLTKHICTAGGRIGQVPIFHPTPAVRIEYPCTTDELITLFSNAKRFYCYDLFTLCNMIAPMCGCICIVPEIRDPRLGQLYRSVPWIRHGIAQGDSDEEIEVAEKSLGDVRGELYEYFRGRNILTIHSIFV